MKRVKKLLSLVLAAVMVAGLLPAGVLAAEGEVETVPAIQEIGVRIGEDYVAAVPEEGGITPFSLLPLPEKRFNLDLTGYFPDELKAVTLETMIAGLTPNGTEDAAEADASKYVVWAKQSYYDEDGNHISDSDDFKVLSDPKTLDLSSKYGNCRLELIVGTADQLDPNNTRYIVQVSTSSGLGDMLVFSAKTIENGEIQIYNHSNYYGEDQNDKNYYQLAASPENFPSGESKLSFGFSDTWKTRTWTEIKVYQGYYETAEDLPSDTAKDVTSTVWSSGSSSPNGFQADYRSYWDKPQFTLVLKKGETTLVLPFGVYMYAANINIYPNGLYEKKTSGSSPIFSSVYAGSAYEYDNTNNIEYRIILLSAGKELSGTYYLRLNVNDPAEETYDYNDIEKVKSAYVGKLTQADIQNKSAADDIKANLFYDSDRYSDSEYDSGYKGGGYAVVPSQHTGGIVFTVVEKNDRIHYVGVKFEASLDETDELPPAPDPLSRDTYFRMNSAAHTTGHTGSYIRYYVMPYGDDSYYYDGYQTVFLLDEYRIDNDTNTYYRPVKEDKIRPSFTTGNKVVAASNGLPYDPENAPAATNQTSGTSVVTFQSGVPILYSAKAESGSDLKNYVVTFLTQQENPTLFVNGTNYSASYQDDPQNEGQKIPARVVHLTKEYGFHHDIFFANLGADQLTDLSVALTGLDGTGDAEGVLLDDYWTIGATKSLAGFTTTEKRDKDGQYVSYGELPNVGKIRLQPVRDENGEIVSGRVSGLLTISAGAGGDRQEVQIVLSGISGDFKIVTTDAVDGVKYVSYSSVIQTNSAGASDAVTFEVTDGKLPDGVELRPNGELYGVPSKVGTYRFTLTATYTETVGGTTYTQNDSREFSITITDNTDQNVWYYDGGLFDDGIYAIETAIPNENNTANIFGDATAGDNSWSNPTQVLYSKGDYGTFVNKVFLDKEELRAGIDYTSESGSTRIVLNTSALKSKGNGTHTISAEFRVGGENGTLRRAAQNYTLTTLGTNSSGSGSGSGSGGSSSSGSPSYTISAPSRTPNGTVRVSPSNAKKGNTVTITVTPDNGYELDKLTITDSKGNNIKVIDQGGGKFTFTMPNSKVSVNATFVKTANTPVSGFTDVNPGAYYADAVAWAIEKGITVGTGADTFSPNSPCTRAQIVTFLWRAAGSPLLDGDYMFDDVAPGSYYYDAVRWAMAQGITVGTGGNTFSPDAVCTRAQAVTFLYRYEQSPAVSDGNAFSDVASGTYYTNAVQWAADKGVTLGTSSTTFSPNATCTRSQIVTFLYRDMA